MQEQDSKEIKVEKPVTDIRKIIEFAPIILFAGLLYGCSKLFYFYNYFDLNIFNYIGLSELVKAVIKDSIAVGILVFIFILLARIIFKARLEKRTLFVVLVLLCAFTCLLFMYHIISTMEHLGYFIGLLVVPLAVGVVLYYILKNKNQAVLMTLIFIAGSIGSFNGFDLASKVSTGYTVGNKIYLENDKSVTSTKNYIYIGKTADFIFFYDKKRKKTDVYKMENVEQLSIKHDL